MGLHCTHTQDLVCTAFYIFFISILGDPIMSILGDPIMSSLDEVSYEKCKPSHCGGNHGLNINYPFYIRGGGRELCGYPGFEITCEGTKPTYADYSIKNISYEESSIELASLLDTPCFLPRPVRFNPIGIFLRNSVFLLRTLHFFYNCTGPFSLPFPTSPVSCPSNATYNSSVALLPSPFSLLHDGTFHHLTELCESLSMVTVQLKGGFSNQSIKDIDYKELLKNGLRLNWNVTNKTCTGCRESGGRCGRSQDTDFLCYCPNGANHPSICNSGGKLKAGSLLKKGALGASISAFGVAIIVLAYLCQHKISKLKSMIIGSKKMKKSHKFEVDFENRGILVAKRYSYADIKRMTNSFKEKVGEGGYGCVYKGKLADGLLVAVKILSKLKGDGGDFINEVNSMSKTSHVNIVKLLGFCFHKTKRALVYEYMPNGSLEKLTYEENYFKVGCGHLGWDTLYQISLGIAHGLEYLHKGCNSRILHFDIKPHNILLNENYCPKISDFGLAKICHLEKSTISLLGARGTAGFIAPEVFCRNIGGISQKSDVYSFGMTMLEMVGGRKNIVTGEEKTSEIYFPHWIHKRLELQEELGLQNVTSKGDKEKAEKMVIVGLWCIQTNPSIRPTMSEVVDMLRGGIDCLRVPPKPYLSSPSRSSPTTSMSMVM